MKTYEFNLILTDVQEMTEEFADALYEAGCDDGTPFSGNGVTTIAFDREANSLKDAITSAIADVEKAGVKVARVEIGSDELAVLRA